MALGLVAAGASLTVWQHRPADAPIETIGLTRPTGEAPAMCPWRTPAQDMAAFFPGADRYETRTLILSGLRIPLKQRLGARTPLETNRLYAYPVWQGRTRRGTMLVQRAAGDYGALELVVGVGPNGRVAGARVQRHREPPEIARAITSPVWLGAFRGKTAQDAWRPGLDLPAVSAVARPAARTLADTARALLIERDVAAQHGLAR